ncbi:MAG: hypothetical protein IJO26_05575 [Clostridium sp.]|nr:hypothetical protein [Clostridium sp.]
MDLAVQIFQIVFYSLGALFMITFGIIGIWSFIIFNKHYKTKRIQNYILEKIYQSINNLTYKSPDIISDNHEDLANIEDLFDNESKKER